MANGFRIQIESLQKCRNESQGHRLGKKQRDGAAYAHQILACMTKRRVEFLNLIAVPKRKLTIINPIIYF